MGDWLIIVAHVQGAAHSRGSRGHKVDHAAVGRARVGLSRGACTVTPPEPAGADRLGKSGTGAPADGWQTGRGAQEEGAWSKEQGLLIPSSLHAGPPQPPSWAVALHMALFLPETGDGEGSQQLASAPKRASGFGHTHCFRQGQTVRRREYAGLRSLIPSRARCLACLTCRPKAWHMISLLLGMFLPNAEVSFQDSRAECS